MDAMTARDPHDAAERRRVAALLHMAAATGRDQMALLGHLRAAVLPEAERDWGHWTWGDVIERLASLMEPGGGGDE